MAWVFLLATIVLEGAGTTALKLSEEFTRLVPTILILVFYGQPFDTTPHPQDGHTLPIPFSPI